MKTQVYFILFFCLLAFGLHAQQNGSMVYDELTLPSKILKSDRKYAIYLPPGYQTSQRSYPVLYLLHGAGDNQTGWVQFGEVQHITDKAIAEGIATPMIIVMPDADTERRGYFNDIRGDFNYEDFFFQELIPYIEKNYRCRSEKRYRAIAGLSMGGGGTLIYALHHPEMFASACPLSASARVMDKTRLGKSYKDANITEKQLDEWSKKYDIHGMVKNMPEEQKKAVRWYIDCGDDDFLYEGNSLLHIEMRDNNIPHEYRVRDGGHSWNYWRTALPEVLKFVSQGFHQY